jgi:hypothetical protein
MAEWKKVIVSGSDAELRTLTASLAISASNINVGVPTSNQWQSGLNGSYFNNFTTQTDTSEILRFIAGLLSASAPDASPNTKTYSSINAAASNTGTGTISGFYPTGHTSVTNDTLKYLENKGFVSTGGTVFSGIPSVFNNSGYSYAYTSVAGGSTIVSSSADAQLFGLGTLTSGGPTTFRVSGSINWRFDDNSSNTQTAASSSENILTTNTFGTTAGLTLAKINTANPSVIPPAYQDGKFASIFSSGLWNNSVSFTSVSSSGYYHISSSIRIASGSSPYSSAATSFNKIFYAPTTNIATAIGNNTLTVSSTNVVSSGSYTSGSMSGAPFLTSAQYTLSVTASGVFDPLYAANASISSVAAAGLTATGTVNLGLTAGVAALSTVGGTINTSGVVFTSAGSPKNSGVPAYDDQLRYANTYTISGTGRTFAETGATDSDFTITVSALDRSSNSSTLSTNTVPVHTAGTFGQPAASGSLLYFGGGSTPNTTLLENFTSESFRRTIGTSTALTGTWNKDTALTLGDGGPLQVKPGFLVNPESSKGYWYPTGGYNANHYKWYLREFDTGAVANRNNLTITLSPASSADLVDFSTTTSDKISIAVIFEAQLPANSGNTRTRIFDTVKGAASYGGSLNNQGSGLYNPFSDNIDVVGDFSTATNSAGVLTLGLNNSINQTINGTYKKIWLLIRYKGTPANSLQQITVATS